MVTVGEAKKLKVKELREELDNRSLSTDGKKDELLERLLEALQKEADDEPALEGDEEPARKKGDEEPARKKRKRARNKTPFERATRRPEDRKRPGRKPPQAPAAEISTLDAERELLERCKEHYMEKLRKLEAEDLLLEEQERRLIAQAGGGAASSSMVVAAPAGSSSFVPPAQGLQWSSNGGGAAAGVTGLSDDDDDDDGGQPPIPPYLQGMTSSDMLAHGYGPDGIQTHGSQGGEDEGEEEGEEEEESADIYSNSEDDETDARLRAAVAEGRPPR